MDIQRQFPSVHWIWGGGISFVYEVHPRIVVKIPKSGQFEREQFHKEIKDLAQAVAFLESLNLAYGDLRPENVLLDRNRLKLSDFDCTAEIRTNYEACIAPYSRLLNSSESDQGECGTSGFLSPQIEQFALSSLYYLINYGFEVYRDRCLAEDPYEYGPKVVELLQSMEFPNLDGNPLIDNIIDKCWHNKYVTVSELAAHTRMLLNERTDAMESSGSRRKESSEVATTIGRMFIERWRVVIGRIVHRICYGLGVWWRSLLQRINGEVTKAERPNGDNRDDVDQNRLGEEFLSKKKFCQDLEKRGLLHVLLSGEPEQIGFTFDWYRHSLSG